MEEDMLRTLDAGAKTFHHEALGAVDFNYKPSDSLRMQEMRGSHNKRLSSPFMRVLSYIYFHNVRQSESSSVSCSLQSAIQTQNIFLFSFA